MGARGLIAGGILAGLGQGITAQANSVRDRALRQMDNDAQNARQTRQLEVQQEEGRLSRQATADNADKQITAAATNTDKQIGATAENTKQTLASAEKRNTDDNSTRRGLIVSTFTDDSGEVNAVDAGGNIKPTGKKALEKDLSKNQKLELENAKIVATEEQFQPNDPSDPSAGGKTVKVINPEKYAKALSKSKDPLIKGMADAAKAANAPIGSEGPDVNADDEPSATVTPDGYADKPSGPRGLVPPSANGDLAKLGSRANPHKPMSEADMQKIEPGEAYIDPDDGQIYTRK